MIFLRDTKGIKVLPPNRRVNGDETLVRKLEELFGQGNVKIKNSR